MDIQVDETRDPLLFTLRDGHGTYVTTAKISKDGTTFDPVRRFSHAEYLNIRLLICTILEARLQKRVDKLVI